MLHEFAVPVAVGRALRRMSYATTTRTLETPSGPKEIESFAVEYAEVYGVPFSFIASNGPAEDAKPGPIPTRVRALPERIASRITFPRLDGYRYELPAERLEADFTTASKLTLSSQQVPTKVESAPIVGETAIHTLDELKKRRPQEVAFHIARQVMTHYFGDSDATPAELKGQSRPWLFPDLLAISSQWLKECVVLKDNAFPQLLLLAEYRQDAADRIYKAVVQASSNRGGTGGVEKRLLPILKPYDPIGSTNGVSFDTVKPTYRTSADKCHVSHVVADTGSWEQKLAQTLEDMPEVVSYVKNQNLGFFIPYQVNGQQRSYIPDFIVRINDGHALQPDGTPDLLNLILEVTGEKDKDKEAKVSTAQALWVPAVNNAGTFGRWAFFEDRDPWSTRSMLKLAIEKHSFTQAKVATCT